ncbi:MAG: aldehyde dehydrogenase family protein [Flavobacteriaceae bacterium]|uniref:aldehyde dehydrogenase family protein n=1 Tax=Maribacter dokdonensis TaxID=320912 RepID=UPI00326B2DB1
MNKEVQQFLSNKTKGAFINGKFVNATSEKAIAVVNPATEETLSEVVVSNKELVNEAVQAANHQLENGDWSKLLANKKEYLLLKYADLIEENTSALAELLVLEHGKLLSDAKKEVSAAVNCFRYYAGWATKIEGSTIDVSLSGGNHFAYTKREPVGVVGAIAPWNVPIMMYAWKIAPALACGCTIVFKPSEETPLTSLLLAELSKEVGIPDGVINIVPGDGATTGQAITNHPLISKITFTGSSATGRIIGQNSAKLLKEFTLELGGKNPVLVLDDADFSKVPGGVAKGIFYNQGQVCVSGSRLYLPKNKFDNTLADIASIAEKMKLGSGLDENTKLGPVVSKDHFNKVMNYIDEGKQDSIEVVTGGGRAFDKGYFVEPTVFANTDNKAVSVATDEIFGPVITAMPYSNVDDLLEKANATEYGLSASIWTSNLGNAHYLADKVKAGIIYINSAVRSDPNLPLGGFKQSGIGSELGKSAINGFTKLKSVCINY